MAEVAMALAVALDRLQGMFRFEKLRPETFSSYIYQRLTGGNNVA